MKFRLNLHFLAIIFTLLTSSIAIGREYIIYSIVQDFPMGQANEILKKNFYVNIGAKQGVKEGVVLDVYRNISRNDPYKNKQTYHHKVKIGELKILHTEDENAIASLEQVLAGNETAPLFEIGKFMIGDKVSVKVD